jgi:Cytidylate kinase-like family
MSVDSVSPLKNYLSALSLPRKRKSETPRPAVTISRESGAGALAVASLVANRLNLDCPGDVPCAWAVFDRNLITQILDDHSLSKKIEEFMPEDARFPLSEAFEYLLGLHPAGWTLREHAKDTIRKLATNGNVILVGRAGAIITADLPYVLHVRLVAPFEFRIRNYAQSQGIGEKRAVKEVRANDQASQRYVRSYFNTNVNNHWHYDLVINTASIGFECAAHVICTALQDLSADWPRASVHPHFSIRQLGSKIERLGSAFELQRSEAPAQL